MALWIQEATAASERQIDEEAFVSIGGIEQWVTIKGDDRSNPVVLILHGGPGAAFSPFDDSVFDQWRRTFTVVQWDQRGAGRTFSRNGGTSIEPTMTIDRMVQDGIEASEYLQRHLHKKKIVLFGGSWGSILGINMVKRRPDLFCAYVGTAQMVRSNMQLTYERVRTMITAAGDQAAIKDFAAIGPPPWKSFQTFMTFIRWVGVYEAKHATPLNMDVSPKYASDGEREAWGAAMMFSVQHFFGTDLSGPLMRFDLPMLGTDFKVPVFIAQGENDLRAPADVARAYFDSIRAPRKEFFLVPRTGHEPSPESMKTILNVLSEQVRPACH